MGLVLVKVSHCYVGTLESWLERGGGKGTLVVDAQDIKSWKKRDQRSAPYTVDRFDPSLGSWLDIFLTEVGEDMYMVIYHHCNYSQYYIVLYS